MENVQGSNVFSNVRESGAATWSAASLFVVAVLFFLPHFCFADGTSTLVWGDVAYDDSGATTSDDRIFMQDGGTYAVSLTAAKSAVVENTNYPNVHGLLYLQNADGTRTFITTLYTGYSETPFTWPAAGDYELDLYQPILSVPVSMLRSVKDFLIGPTAYAQDAPVLVDMIHFTITDENAAPQPSNVLFIPGIEASRLYDSDNGETRLWEPGGDALSQNLALDSNGQSIRSDIYTRDVIDTAYGLQGLYEFFIQSMNALKSSGAINDWASAPYDWRLSLDQILTSGAENGGNISYTASTDTPYIIQTLKQLAATSKSGKVTIVAHSNGGLVAKALTEKLGADASKYIDKIIFVAVPQVGTPEAIGALLNGYDQGISLIPPATWIPGDVKITDGEMRTLGDNSPTAYNLLPSASYFSTVNDPVVMFSTSTLPDWVSKYGASITSENAFTRFLTDFTGRGIPTQTDTADPTVLNENLLDQSQVVHDSLDPWTPPQGIQLIQIAGWGVPSTLSGIEYGREADGATTTETPQFTIDGDGVVVVPSALWTDTTTGALDYWFNLQDYNDQRPILAAADYASREHGNILEALPLDSFISDIITNSQKSLSSYSYLSTASPTADPREKRLEYALHSPLTLDLYDNQGRHTGISTTTGLVEEQIPGTYYTEFGDVKYIFADEGLVQTIDMSGYATGTFTLNINEVEGDNTVVASTTFANVPTTPETTATIELADGLSSVSDLDVESGTSTISIAPVLDGVATLPPIAASSTVATSTDTQADSPTVPAVDGGGPLYLATSTATTSQEITATAPVAVSATSSLTTNEVTKYRFLVSFLSLLLKGINLTASPQKFPYNSVAAIISAFLHH